MNIVEIVTYESPQVEIIEVEVERGFAQSEGTPAPVFSEEDW